MKEMYHNFMGMSEFVNSSGINHHIKPPKVHEFPSFLLICSNYKLEPDLFGSDFPKFHLQNLRSCTSGPISLAAGTKYLTKATVKGFFRNMS